MHKPSRSRQRLQQYGIPNPIGIRYSEGCAVVVVEGAAVRPMSRGTTTMIIIGIVLSIVGLGFLCWLLFTLAVYALPLSALCGWPHKANYVASHNMWRTRG